MDLPKQLGDLECSMFEPPAKRSRPSLFQISQAVPKRFLKAYTHVPDEKMGTVSFFARIFPALVALLTGELSLHQYKFSLVLKVEMTKGDGKTKVQTPYFASKPFVILRPEDIDEAIEEGHRNIDTQIDKWTCQGSGWVVTRVLCLYVNIAKYAPLKGSSYIELPKYLKKKEAIINVRNNDSKCLKWALLSALHPVEHGSHPDRVSKYKPYENELNFAGVGFPITLKDIPNVEKQNNLAINVFGYSESARIHPLYITKDNDKSPINLLLISEVKDGKVNSHYCWIKNFDRLCHNQNKHHGKTFFCTRCISPHWTKQTLEEHLIHCKGVDAPPCHAVFPEKSEDGTNPTIKFKNIQHMMKAPYVVYADTESIIKPTTTPNTDTNTVQSSEHIPCSFAYVIVRSDGKVISERLYRGEDAMNVFFDWLEQELENIREDLKHIRPLQMTEDDWDRHNAADTCWICDGPFKPYEQGDTGGLWKVRDHDHLTGKYRGPAHSKCNLSLRIDPYRTPIPVFFHNLKNYDSHHLISAIGRTEEKKTAVTDKNGKPIMYKDSEGKDTEKPVTVTDGSISAIVQNMEKLISFSWGQFRFVDSFAFLNSSLDKLVKNTPKKDLRITRQQYPNRCYLSQSRRLLNDTKFHLVTQKGVYPYEYMDSLDRFDEKELPTQVIH